MAEIQTTPISGREDVTDASPQLRALIAFYAAFNDHDADGLRRIWADGDDVVMDNPVGGITRGKEAIMDLYRHIGASSARVYVEFGDYTLHEAGEMLYAVGRERGSFFLEGQHQTDLVIRTTRVFRLIGGEWKLVHHHGSIDDPDLLDRYLLATNVTPGS
jgi:ketosteroid isomerase-like protein